MNRAALALLLLSAPVLALAQETGRREEEIFGAPAPSEPSARPAEPAVEAEIASTLRRTEDPLKLGGLLYLRALTQWQQGVPPSDWTLAAPALVDVFLDARPNDRVRGFTLVRLQYDLARAADTSSRTASATGSGSFLDFASLLGNPTVLLDQAWVRFDVGRVAFVSAGKQHVKWSTARFWNPTDFFHPVRRDPLAVFDARAGETMLKVHVPWEKRGWNFYGVAFTEGQSSSGRLGDVGGALRAEVVAGTAELGLTAWALKGRDARLGVDFSAGVGEVDVYGEAVLRRGSDVPLWRRKAAPPAGGALVDAYESWTPDGLRPAASVGATWSYKYSDEDTFTVGAEYFLNANGYDDAEAYPVLLFQQAVEGRAYFTPFYLGRHYAAAFLLLPKPGSWNDTTFTLSTLGNLSDRTFISRVDYSVRVLTYLTVEAYAGVHFGRKGGEFRLGLDLLPADAPGLPAPLHLPAPVLDLGVALRVSL